MKIQIKYIALILVACFLGMDMMHAQERRSNESEIVMTQSELDSLLLKIRRYKQRELAKQREYNHAENKRRADEVLAPENRYANQEINKRREAGFMEMERIYNEFARLNNRIDGLILNMHTGNQVASGTSYVPQSSGSSPNVIYIQPDGSQSQKPFAPGIMGNQMMDDANQPKPTERVETPAQQPKADSGEAQKLQDEIAQLSERVRVLDKLGETTNSKEYDGEISELTARIEGLKSDLDESRKKAEEEKAKREESEKERAAKIKEMKDLGLTVYFANNSKNLSNSDRISLEKLAESLQHYKGQYTLLLHGFASKSGSAAYNNKISFERAEAVKNTLRQHGVDAKDIVIYPHGIDESGNAEQARRVEVSIKAQ